MVMIHNTTSILLVGFGNMGSALFRGWVDMGISHISILSPNKPDSSILNSCENFYTKPEDIKSSFDVIILAIKPQILKQVCKTLSPILDDNSLIISIAAGKTLDTVSQYIGSNTLSIVRAMPNLPVSVAKGISVCCANKHCSSDQRDIADALMGGVGDTEWIENEEHMHAITALSGSGPAYLFLLVEAMTKAGIENGLPDPLSMKLARETVIGSAHLLEQSSLTAKELRKNVTSKGGTTEAALDTLIKNNEFFDLMFTAIESAKKRSQSL